jgi:hypothetical protein
MKRFLLVSHNKALSKYCHSTPICGLRTCLLLTSLCAGLLTIILTVCAVISSRWIRVNVASNDDQLSNFSDISWRTQSTTKPAPLMEEIASQSHARWRSRGQSDYNSNTAVLLVKQQQLSFELCFSADKEDNFKTTDTTIDVADDDCLLWTSLVQLHSGLWTICTLNQVGLNCGKVAYLILHYKRTAIMFVTQSFPLMVLGRNVTSRF